MLQIWILGEFVKIAGFRPELEPDLNSGTGLVTCAFNFCLARLLF